MPTTAFSLFATPLGTCAIGWNDRGISGVQLPEPSEKALRRRTARVWPEANEAEPPPTVGRTIDEIGGLLRGEPLDLADAILDDQDLADFDRRVYAISRTIPPGRTITYGELARRLEEPGAAQAVGRSLGRNPYPIVVPCHRIVGADGRMTGFSAPGGTATKRRLLVIEGAWQYDQASLFD